MQYFSNFSAAYLQESLIIREVMFTYWRSVNRVTFAKVSKLFKKPPPLIILRDSPHEGLQQGLSGSAVTGSTFLKNSSNTQSIMRMIRWGGLASFLTVAMCAGLMVCNAASASSNAGLAASSFSSATALSSYWSKNSMFSVSYWFSPSTLSNCIYLFIYRKPSIKTPRVHWFQTHVRGAW